MDIERWCFELERRLAAGQGSRDEIIAAAVPILCRAFRVQEDEVAIFALTRLFDQEVLRFLWPRHLAASPSGYVPLTSVSSLAVRTYLENMAFINLMFSSTPHTRYFELLPVDPASRQRPPAIQQIISAPLRLENSGFQGVIQISHKEMIPPPQTGFCEHDLNLLTALAPRLAHSLSTADDAG